jgi:hypothetical protein
VNAPELGYCFAPMRKRWRAVKALDWLYDPENPRQVEWINHGSEWHSGPRPQVKVVGHQPFPIDLDAEVFVCERVTLADAVELVREAFPGNTFTIQPCTEHEHAEWDEGAA